MWRGIKLNLKLDHIIHYIHQLESFKFPGEILELQNGGRHHHLGTFNQIAPIKNSYIELLDVENESKLSNIAKTEEGRVSFATKIVQDHFKQGFKGICFRTKDINQVKSTLENRGVDVIGPIDMERENKKGHQIRWRLLYIANPDYTVKPPFFIEWDNSRKQNLSQIHNFNLSSFKIKEVIITSTQRETTVSLWKEWYNMKIVNETATSTDLKLETDEVIYKIEDGKDSGFHTLIMADINATAPYSIFIRGAKYRFEPPN